ncbi:amidohydrolase [Kitasatospora sp. MMS16-BH015]|uniref:amidohydrolase family protein n=1 Tax=Kitasatospora sp. MMS16-BH015 TaxID=2018025 RepID=UPI000CA3E138|nr:amidohydrolase family protein [Kitasatospora sp. MMS16-BH015]AUG76134.1 amidohydrolase [Kitasatospora sp. MMS16-BH015]
MSGYRIDTHHHIVPPAYAKWLAARGITAGGMPLPAWSQAGALAAMDELAVRTAVLSVSMPGVHLGDDDEARRMAREVNEYAAEQVKDRPDRFGLFATLTLPDVDGALAEAAYAFDVLGADGVVLLANSAGHYLGDRRFDPLMDELNRRAAVVFVHPSQLGAPPVEGIPPFLTDFLLDTTRAAVNLVHAEAPWRWPELKIVLSHGGGFVPYAAHRIAWTRTAAKPTPERVLEGLRSFWFDTALSTSPVALPSLRTFARPDRILFGTDWPYAPEHTVRHFAGAWSAWSDIDPGERAAVERGNAEAILPRLREQLM